MFKHILQSKNESVTIKDKLLNAEKIQMNQLFKAITCVSNCNLSSVFKFKQKSLFLKFIFTFSCSMTHWQKALMPSK